MSNVFIGGVCATCRESRMLHADPLTGRNIGCPIPVYVIVDRENRRLSMEVARLEAALQIAHGRIVQLEKPKRRRRL